MRGGSGCGAAVGVSTSLRLRGCGRPVATTAGLTSGAAGGATRPGGSTTAGPPDATPGGSTGAGGSTPADAPDATPGSAPTAGVSSYARQPSPMANTAAAVTSKDTNG